MEAGVIVDVLGNPIYWHEPKNRTTASLPDSVELWDAIWKAHVIARDAEAKSIFKLATVPGAILGFAHSHPGRGMPGPSYEDVTTFAAVERALGRRLRWWIVSEDHFVVIVSEQFINAKYESVIIDQPSGIPSWYIYQMEGSYPSWVYELRERSGMKSDPDMNDENAWACSDCGSSGLGAHACPGRYGEDPP